MNQHNEVKKIKALVMHLNMWILIITLNFLKDLENILPGDE